MNMDQQISELLSAYENQLGEAFNPYLNHAIRVGCIAEKLSVSDFDIRKFAIACAFHDLGIWTQNTWDYLEPSEELASEYLRQRNQVDLNAEVISMIHHHHKLTSYKGDHEDSVELFRKADLVDFSNGLILFGLDRKWYSRLKQNYPANGFYKELGRNFWKHFKSKPWNPFPMVRF